MIDETRMAKLGNKARLSTLAETQLMDAPPDPGLDRTTKLASEVLESAVSLISLVDQDRQFFASACGLPEPFASRRETPLTHSFCQHVVISKRPLIIEDARTHDLVSSNLAITDLNVISYLGVPLEWHGETIGALCVINGEPKQWSERELALLQGFAEIIEQQIEVRHYAVRARNLAHQNATLAREYHHRIKNALSVSGALISLSAKEAKSISDLVSKTNGRLLALAKAHDTLLSDIETVKLDELAQKLLRPYAAEDGNAVISGPLVVLTADQVTPLCLVLHELATNSAKYGAFGNQGTVTLVWKISPDDLCAVIWEENVASPNHPNTSTGFGSLLLKTATAQLGGTITNEWSASGIKVVIEFPLAAVTNL